MDAATWFYMCPSATAVEAVSQDLKRYRKREYPQGLQPELGWGCRWGNAKVIPQFPIALMTELETRVGRPHCYIMEQPHGGSVVNVKSYTLYNSYNSVWQDPTCNCVTMHVSIWTISGYLYMLLSMISVTLHELHALMCRRHHERVSRQLSCSDQQFNDLEASF